MGRGIQTRFQDMMMMAVGLFVMFLGIAGTIEEMMVIMFCKKCGSKINDTWDFCGSCGERVERVIFDSDLEEERSIEPEKSTEIKDVNIEEQVETDAAEEQCTENISEEKGSQKETIFSKIWNSAIFTMIAMKFGILVDIVEIIVCLFLGIYLLGDGFFCTILGIMFCAFAILPVVAAVKRFLNREKKVYSGRYKGKKEKLVYWCRCNYDCSHVFYICRRWFLLQGERNYI